MVAFLKASAANEPIFLQVYGPKRMRVMILRAHTLDSLKIQMLVTWVLV